MSFPTTKVYKGHEENKSKIGQGRSSMQQVDYHSHRPTPRMQESVSMHKSPTQLRQSRMNRARSEEEEKERKRDRKDWRQMERKASQQKKNTSEELKQGLPT